MSKNTPQAGLIKRLAALIYDLLIIVAISFVYGWAILMAKYQWFDVPLPESGRAELEGLEGFLLIVIIILFYSFFWRRGGQTLGMKAWRLKLLDANGGPPSWGKCILRCLIAPISLTIGYLWAFVDSDNKCLQDRLSGTQVIEIEKSSPPKKTL